MFSKYNERNIYIYSAFILAGTFFAMHNSLLYLIMFFVVPMLISYCFYAYSFTEVILVCLSALIFNFTTTYLTTPDTAVLCVINTLIMCIPGFIIGYCFKIKTSYKDVLIYTSALDLIIILAVLAFVKYATKTNITEVLHNELFALYYNQIDILKSLSDEFAKVIEHNEDSILSILYICIPGLFPFVATVIIVLANTLKFTLCKIICSAMMINNENFSDGFDVFKTSIVSVVTFAILALVVLLSESMNAFMIAANAMLIIVFLYYLQGLSVTEFKMKQKFISPLPRLIIIIGILAISLLTATIFPIINIIYVFVFIGIMDMIFDFRKLNYNKDEANE